MKSEKNRLKIDEYTRQPFLNISLDTLKRNKQALVFVNTKRRAEKKAEEIHKKIKLKKSDVEKLAKLSYEILNVLSSPTKQCKRLAKVVKKGIAFHHSGLAAKQKTMIETAFRQGTIKIICCTPTLAAGLDLPAFRSVILDLNRYGGRFGMVRIPVLEYHQIAGRAGRPGKDDYGEAICIAGTESEKKNIFKNYVYGEPEKIYSKLAVEPVLRTHVLSLISTRIVRTKKELLDFFKKTFWAHQYMDMDEIEDIITDVIEMLVDFEFIKTNEERKKKNIADKGFISANEIQKKPDDYDNYEIKPTQLGIRISQLYLDPLSANYFIENLSEDKRHNLAYLTMICSVPEIEPKIRARKNNIEEAEQKLLMNEQELFDVPNEYDFEYEDFIHSFNTALCLQDWMNEEGEDYLLEKYNVAPGILNYKLNIVDWLLYACEEISKLKGYYKRINDLEKLRIRLKFGIKEKLIPLVRLKHVGRVRARKLYNSGLKDLGALRKASVSKIAGIVGKKIAVKIKNQLGQEVKEGSLKDYSK